jgi:hypothetical protein
MGGALEFSPLSILILGHFNLYFMFIFYMSSIIHNSSGCIRLFIGVNKLFRSSGPAGNPGPFRSGPVDLVKGRNPSFHCNVLSYTLYHFCKCDYCNIVL